MIRFYMDHHVPRSITEGLRLRGIDVLTAYEDGRSTLDDHSLLNRATELERVLFSQDDDLLAEAAKKQREGARFSGVVYAHQLRIPIGLCIADLDIIAKTCHPKELENQTIFLPL